MADNVSITAGSGTTIATDDVSGVQFQKVKIDVGGDGVSKPIVQGGTDGIPVDLLSGPTGGIVTKPLSGQVWPINDNSGSITVDDGGSSLTIDAPVGTPAFVRLSDGSSAITTLPVSGTVTANQGTAAAASAAWPIKVSDGTSTVGISTVGSDKALKIDVVQTVGGAPAQADSSTFTAASSDVSPIAGVFNDGIADPSSGQAAGARITQKRAVHVNVRKNDGTELGIAATPLRTDPTGSTIQPVSGTVAATQSGAWVDNITKIAGSNVVAATAGVMTVGVVDEAGAAFSDTNPLPTAPALIAGRTRVTKSVALTASQTGTVLWTPTSGKKFIITQMDLLISVTGALTIFDGTNAAANIVTDGVSGAWTVGRHIFNYQGIPWPSATIDNVLKYTSGSGLTGILTVHGYEV